MEFSKKWIVTFTKHIKQKRKVYQDGTLELSISGDKISLYDESENLIESKFVSKDESIESGKTLTMISHLVDIGDCISRKKNPPQNPNSVDENKKNSIKKNPLHKVLTSTQNNSNSTHSILKEWNILYTTQLTQKAKKFHDGTLRLSQLGSHAKQVQLFDENERVLESKVLKKDEVVDSGRTFLMAAHLVDIGDLTLNNKDKVKVKQARSSNVITIDDEEEGKEEKKNTFQRKPFQTASNTMNKNCVIEVNKKTIPHAVLKEWDVLYTTQVTQKAKKYHDGVLQLIQVGTHAKQIILMSEESNVLTSRYLKSSENVESGSKCEISNYLVDVCGLRSNKETRLDQPGTVKIKEINLTNDEEKKVTLKKKKTQIASFKSPHIGTVNMTSQILIPSNNADENIKKKSITEPRRDACQILSILKRPNQEEESGEREARVERTRFSSSHNIQIVIEEDEHEKKEDSRSEVVMDDSVDCPSFDLGF